MAPNDPPFMSPQQAMQYMPGQQPTVARFINITNGSLQLDDSNVLRLGVFPRGGLITVPTHLLSHPTITTCLQNGWIVPEDHPAAAPFRQPTAPTHFSYVGEQSAEVPGNVPGVLNYMPHGVDAVNLPGVMPRGFNLDGDAGNAPAVADAQGIITDGRSRPDQSNEVMEADQVIRASMRTGGNPIVPQFTPHNPALNAQGVIMSKHTGVQNVAVAPPQMPGYPPQYGQPAAFTVPAQPGMPSQPVQYVPPFMPNVPTPVVGQPQQNVATSPPFVGPQAPPIPMQGVYPVAPQPHQVMGQQIVRQAGRAQMVNVVRPTPPAHTNAPNNMGQLIVNSDVPGGATLRDIGEMSGDMRGSVEANTNALLNGIDRNNKMQQIFNNYRDWPDQKKLFFLSNSVDLEILYKLFQFERSGSLSSFIQNRIVQLGGQVPDLSKMAPPPQQQPQAVAGNVVQNILLTYPDWDEPAKLNFIANVNNSELLEKLQKREPNANVSAKIAERINQINAGLQEAIVDKPLPTPVAPAPQVADQPQVITVPAPTAEQVQQTVAHVESHPPFVAPAGQVAQPAPQVGQVVPQAAQPSQGGQQI